MSEMNLTGYEGTAASTLVRIVDAALGDWDRAEAGPGLWVWRSEWDERCQVVAVNALADRVFVPVEGWPAKVGPTLLGGDKYGLFASATVPHVSDASEMREAIAVVAVLVPDLEPATWSTS
ncbi:hypothetical protein ABT297_04140 [Dactylosporangium sp. NPDC000555]|uniref:hypothetical protein n=1 Tax=Dactylosporangium sp. NPDC000555 TaxID=3154260 RepID=UPI00331EF742